MEYKRKIGPHLPSRWCKTQVERKRNTTRNAQGTSAVGSSMCVGACTEDVTRTDAD